MGRCALFGMLLCNLFSLAQQAYFSSKPPRKVIKATIGKDVVIPWNVTLESIDRLLFMKLEYSRNNAFDASSQRIAFRMDDNMKITKAFKDKVTVEGNGKLTLHNISLQQRGFYKCGVEFEESPLLIDKVQIIVGVAPVIRSFRWSKIKLLEGDDFDITCEATGIPEPNVSWYRQEGKDRWTEVGLRRLRIKNAKFSSAGYFKCIAGNYMGEATKAVRINVYGRPKVTAFFHTTALDDTIYECDKVTLICEALNKRPLVKNIYIYHEERLVRRSTEDNSKEDVIFNTKLLVSSNRTGQLVISRVKKENEGRYFCIAKNEHGVGYNETINLIVKAAPSNCKKVTTTESSTSFFPTNHSITTSKKKVVIRKLSGCDIPAPRSLLLGLCVSYWIFLWFM